MGASLVASTSNITLDILLSERSGLGAVAIKVPSISRSIVFPLMSKEPWKLTGTRSVKSLFDSVIVPSKSMSSIMVSNVWGPSGTPKSNEALTSAFPVT